MKPKAKKAFPVTALVLAKDFHSRSAKQYVRGLFGRSVGNITADDLERILHSVSPMDCFRCGLVFGHLTEEGNPAFLQGFPSKIEKLFAYPRLSELSIEKEVYFQTGRLSANRKRVDHIYGQIESLNISIENNNVEKFVAEFQNIVATNGYSACLIRKLSLMQTLNPGIGGLVKEIEKLINTASPTSASTYFYLSDAICDISNPYIDVIRYWDKIARPDNCNSVRNIFQQTLWPVPPSLKMASWYLRAAGNTSLIDLSICLRALGENIDSINRIISTGPDPNFSTYVGPSISTITKTSSQHEAQDKNLEKILHRRGLAFIESSDFVRWRASIDKSLGPRLSDFQRDQARNNEIKYVRPEYFAGTTLKNLATRESAQGKQFTRYVNAQAGTFLRACAVAHVLDAGERLSKLPIPKFINLLETTENLSNILTSQELKEIYQAAFAKNEHLVAFLSLVMLTQKDPSAENNFDLIETFQSLVLEWFKGDLLGLLDWMFDKAPEVAAAVVDVLDEEFIKNLYMLVDSYHDVMQTRAEICRWAFRRTSDHTYEIMAQRIETELKVAKVTNAIDNSRIYVAPSDFRKWAEIRVSPLLDRYKQLRITHADAAKFIPTKSLEVETNISELATESGPLFYLIVASDTAFSQFCLNPIWGISAYLCRRIRHGTLIGHLEKPIWEKIEQFKKANSSCRPEVLQAIDELFAAYKSKITHLRDEQIQFRTEHHPEGLFSLDLIGDQTRRLWLVGFLRILAEQLHNGVPSSNTTGNFFDYCWGAFSSDFPRVRNHIAELRRYIVHDLVAEKLGPYRDSSIEVKALEMAIRNIISERFEEFASWFTKPDNVASVATIGDLVGAADKYVVSYTKHYNKNVSIIRGSEIRVTGQPYHDLYDLIWELVKNAAEHGDKNEQIQVGAELIRDYAMIETDEYIGCVRVQVISRITALSKADRFGSIFTTSTLNELERQRAATEGGGGVIRVRAMLERQHRVFDIDQSQRALSYDLVDRTLTITACYPLLIE